MLAILATGLPARADTTLKDWREAKPLAEGSAPAFEKGAILAEAATAQLRSAIVARDKIPGFSPDGWKAQGEAPQPIPVFGRNRIDDAHDLLVIGSNVGMYGAPESFALIMKGGTLADMAVIAQSVGDAGAAMELAWRFKNGSFLLSETSQFSVELGPPERILRVFPNGSVIASRESWELSAAADGRFHEKNRVDAAFTADFRDPATGEEIKIEEYSDDQVWVGYRGKATAPWKHVEGVSIDRSARRIVVRFPSSKTTYELAMEPDKSALKSTGSDGSKPQRFVRQKR